MDPGPPSTSTGKIKKVESITYTVDVDTLNALLLQSLNLSPSDNYTIKYHINRNHGGALFVSGVTVESTAENIVNVDSTPIPRSFGVKV